MTYFICLRFKYDIQECHKRFQLILSYIMMNQIPCLSFGKFCTNVHNDIILQTVFLFVYCSNTFIAKVINKMTYGYRILLLHLMHYYFFEIFNLLYLSCITRNDSIPITKIYTIAIFNGLFLFTTAYWSPSSVTNHQVNYFHNIEIELLQQLSIVLFGIDND